MTREEAIKVLKALPNNIVSIVMPFDINFDYTQAINMAIKALEQEPCEDAVSRQTVLDELRTCFDTHSIYDENNGENYIIYEDAVDMIEKLPSVTPTRKVWIPLVWDEYPTVDSDGNDDYVYEVDYSVPMPKDDEQVLITDENHNVIPVQYDGYDFGDYARENILAWQPLPKPYESDMKGGEDA